MHEPLVPDPLKQNQKLQKYNIQGRVKGSPTSELRYYSLKLCFLESVSIVLVGSEPIDKKQIIGTLLVDSFHISSTFRITPSANFTPIDSDMYFNA